MAPLRVFVTVVAGCSALRAAPALLDLAHQGSLSMSGPNPVSKVATMLRELQEEMEADRATEQGLWDKYNCWYDTVMGAKKASNAEATDQINALTAYIDDIDSGRIEFSSEGADATKEVQELRTEIERSKATRESESKDFEAAKDEMSKTIAALEKAIDIIEEGTKDAKASFLEIDQTDVQHLVDMGRTLLKPADAALLETALSRGNLRRLRSRAPDKEILKDNKHNDKYVERSGKIQGLIKDMLKTFEENLEEAEGKEADAKSLFSKLMSSKEDQLEQAEEALASLGGETASREEAKEEANEEIKVLEEQVKKDNELMDEVTKSFEEQKKAWKERKKLMTLEITAVGEAIAIITSDEARDIMSKAYDDKVGFLQVASSNATEKASSNASSRASNASSALAPKKHVAALHAAATALRNTAKASASERLTQAAKSVEALAKGGDPEGAEDKGKNFDLITKKMNGIKKDMNEEAKEDFEKKKTCLTELKEKTAEAQASSNFIDDKSRFINRTKFEVADLYATVNRTIEEIEEAEWDLNDATAEREAAHNAFEKERAGLQAAMGLLDGAKKALEKFYTDNGLLQVKTRSASRLAMEAQRRAVAKRSLAAAPPDMVVEAGKAPPPPPPIITEDYTGNKGSKNIQSILDDVKGDVEEDKKELEKNEDDAKKEFEDMKKDTEDSIDDKMTFKEDTEKEIADKLSDIAEANNAKLTQKEDLDAVVEALKSFEPDCDFVLTTLETRIRNRKIEFEGINKALEALGGDVDEVKQEEPAAEEE